MFNPSNAELNPICHFLALLRARHILHVSSGRVIDETLHYCSRYWGNRLLRTAEVWFDGIVGTSRLPSALRRGVCVFTKVSRVLQPTVPLLRSRFGMYRWIYHPAHTTRPTPRYLLAGGCRNLFYNYHWSEILMCSICDHNATFQLQEVSANWLLIMARIE